jgi:MoxR-like ATPase
MQNVDEAAARWRSLREQLDRVIIGQTQTKEMLLVAILSGGHVLLEGVPGTGKTLLALAISRLLGCRFKRIQFTPDLMPADLLGANVFNQKSQEFNFQPGPIFTDILLGDEINRSPPRTQAALLEAMQESAVTLDGERRVISPVFTVLATQNPVEFEGTYPLPEAQRDRFLLKVRMTYPTLNEEREMLDAYSAGNRLHHDGVRQLKPMMTPDDLLLSRSIVQKVRVEPHLLHYILKIVTATREDESIELGAGPRASIALLETAKALAVLRGRDFITPDDIKELAPSVLNHRVTLSPEAEMEGTTLDELLTRIFERTEVPR